MARNPVLKTPAIAAERKSDNGEGDNRLDQRKAALVPVLGELRGGGQHGRSPDRQRFRGVSRRFAT